MICKGASSAVTTENTGKTKFWWHLCSQRWSTGAQCRFTKRINGNIFHGCIHTQPHTNYHQLNNTAIKPNSGRNIKKVHVWFSLPWLYQAQAVKMRHLCPSPCPSLFLSTAVTKRATNLWHNNAQKDSIQKRQSVIPSKRVRCSEAIKILKSKDNILP